MNRTQDPDQQSFDEAVIKMIVLAEKEPDLRTVWLMTHDRIEHALVKIIADRLTISRCGCTPQRPPQSCALSVKTSVLP